MFKSHKKIILLSFTISLLTSYSVSKGIGKKFKKMFFTYSLCKSAKKGDIEYIDKFVNNKFIKKEKKKEFVNELDENCNTPFYWACIKKEPKIIKLLLPYCSKETIYADYAYSDNQFQRVQSNLLYRACERKENKVAKLLLPYFTEKVINKVNKKTGRTLLHLACGKDNIVLVNALLKNGAKNSIYKVDKSGDTPLSLACKKGNLCIVKLLLKNVIAPWKIDKDTRSNLLHLAFEKNEMEIVYNFLHYFTKKEINRVDRSTGKTFLHWACHKNDIKLAEFLLKKGAINSMYKVDKMGDTPLSLVCRESRIDVLNLLLKTGVEVRKVDEDTRNDLLHFALEKNAIELANSFLLYCKKKDINRVDKKTGKTFLHWACSKKNYEMVKFLLKKGADPRKVDIKYRDNLFNHFIAKNEIEILALLLPCCSKETINGREVEEYSCYRRGKIRVGNSPLWEACRDNNIELVKLLLLYCTKETINRYPDKKVGGTALYTASRKGYVEIVRLLLENGADSNLSGFFCAPLHLVLDCNENEFEIAKLLIEYGADVNVCNKFGNSPLSIASRFDTIKLLVESGADASDIVFYGTRDTELMKLWISSYVKKDGINKIMAGDIYWSDTFHLSKIRVGDDTLLIHTCKLGNIDIVRLLISKGADVNKPNKIGNTPLSIVSRRGYIDIARLLLKNGANNSVNKTNKFGKTSLHYAAQYGTIEMVELLLKSGAQASINKASIWGVTPLDFMNEKEKKLVRSFKNERKEKCSICLDDLEKGENISITPCKHVYCPECIHSWLIENGKNDCPNCRRSLSAKDLKTGKFEEILK